MTSDAFTAYYRDELLALRRDGYLFGKRYPDLAPQLGLGWGDNPDPMVERIIESLAWFAARIRADSESKLPMAAQQVLRQIHPNFVRPVPSIGIATLTPVDGFGDAQTIPAGSRFHCEGADGEIVRWRTGWPILLSNARVEGAEFCDAGRAGIAGAPGGQCCFRLNVAALPGVDAFRLFLKGDPFSTHSLHEWIHTALLDVHALIPDGDGTTKDIPLGRDALRPGGLSPEDLVLPRSQYAHPAYQLTQEYFACPERFLFWDFFFPDRELAQKTAALVLVLRLPPPETVSARYVSFDPRAVPVVNLYETIAEPISVDHTRHCYPLEADRSNPGSAEIYSIEEIEALFPGQPARPIPYRDVSFAMAEPNAPGPAWRWHERRRRSLSDGGTDIDLFFKCLDPGEMREPFTVSARIVCTNRGNASLVGNPTKLYSEDSTHIDFAVMERPPSRQWSPDLSEDALWRLVSSMTLHRKALSGAKGREALQQILRLFAPTENLWAGGQIAGISELKCEDTLAPLRPTRDRPMGGAAHGHAFSLKLDRAAFTNGSPFLFASVLESFLALFAGINSFTKLTVSAGGGEALYAWPARSGRQRL